MKQITQKEFIKLIEDKQAFAQDAYKRTFQMQPCYETKVAEVTNKAYIDAYQDLICYLNGVEIVPEEQIV